VKRAKYISLLLIICLSFIKVFLYTDGGSTVCKRDVNIIAHKTSTNKYNALQSLVSKAELEIDEDSDDEQNFKFKQNVVFKNFFLKSQKVLNCSNLSLFYSFEYNYPTVYLFILFLKILI